MCPGIFRAFPDPGSHQDAGFQIFPAGGSQVLIKTQSAFFREDHHCGTAKAKEALFLSSADSAWSIRLYYRADAQGSYFHDGQPPKILAFQRGDCAFVAKTRRSGLERNRVNRM